MHDKPKSISDIARLTNRDDISNLQYNVRKLNKAGLIQKSDSSVRKSADSKKGVTYEVTQRGLEVTDQFARFRKELLLSLTQSISNWGEDMETVAKVLNLMSGMYDQAGCVAATHRVFS
jgi:predicted MarR family transcription regulator